jgi:hypothetical protein
VPNIKVVSNIQIYLHAKFHIFLRSLIFLIFLFSHVDLFNWKKDINSKYHRGPLSPRSAQLGASLGPIQHAKPATPSISSGRCQAGPSASRTPPISLSFSWAKNRYAPDPLPRPLRSNPSPSSAPADSHRRRDFDQIHDASIRPRLPHVAPSRPLIVGH